MPRHYEQLGRQERMRIEAWQAQGKSCREIGRLLGRAGSTITREVRRQGRPGYAARRAHHQALQRRSVSRHRPRLKGALIRAYVERHLRRRWSPELVAGRLRRDYPGQAISPEAIYQWIYAARRDLIVWLPRRHFQRRWPRRARPLTQRILGRVSIAARPAVVATRQEAGHWEADTMLSRRAKSVALQVLTERTSRYAVLTKLPDGTAPTMRTTLVRRLRLVPRHLRRTITYDNGPENAEHHRSNAALGMQSYFCHPYHSWERGTVENTIGLVRRFWPKRTDLARVSAYHVKKVEQWLNHRPKKCLQFQTPAEVWQQQCCT